MSVRHAYPLICRSRNCVRCEPTSQRFRGAHYSCMDKTRFGLSKVLITRAPEIFLWAEHANCALQEFKRRRSQGDHGQVYWELWNRIRWCTRYLAHLLTARELVLRPASDFRSSLFESISFETPPSPVVIITSEVEVPTHAHAKLPTLYLYVRGQFGAPSSGLPCQASSAMLGRKHARRRAWTQALVGGQRLAVCANQPTLFARCKMKTLHVNISFVLRYDVCKTPGFEHMG